MIKTRLIVFLMLEDDYVKKSVSFSNARYIGDPLNSVKIFSDFEVDELIVADINATRERREPNYKLLENIASISRMPLCYGGGINDLKQIRRVINMGFEKISISSEALKNPQLLNEAASIFGSQSIVGCLDIKHLENQKYQVFTNNGSVNTNLEIFESIQFLIDNGVGEILVNNISLDGTYKGMDEDLIKKIVKFSNVPITLIGGLKSIDEFKKISRKYNPSGIAAGSLWCFKGINGPVLLNYPNKKEKKKLLTSE